MTQVKWLRPAIQSVGLTFMILAMIGTRAAAQEAPVDVRRAQATRAELDAALARISERAGRLRHSWFASGWPRETSKAATRLIFQWSGKAR
jgi:hypothetical protein